METVKEKSAEYIDADGVRVAAAPEKKSRFYRKNKSIYGDQLICLLALMGMAVWRSGPRAAVICVVAVLAAMLADYAGCKMTAKTYNVKDLSTVCGGLCLALMMPASVSYWLVAMGAVLSMVVKHIFGGKDNYIFNPACLSFAFMVVCYPAQMLSYPKVGEILPVFGDISGTTLYSGLESYLVKLGTTQDISVIDVLIGNFVGPIGTIHVLVLAVCGICMMFRRALSPTVTLTALGAFIAGAVLFPSYDNFWLAIAVELISGNLLFGLIFLVNDPQTQPKSVLGRIYYGLLVGIMAVLFRRVANAEASIVFVLLLANALSIHVDRFADKTIVVVQHLGRLLRKAAGGFERVKASAQEGDSRSLNDTQEIIVPLMNYNMPAIDGKIIKAKKQRVKKVKPERIKSGKPHNSLMDSLRRGINKRIAAYEKKTKARAAAAENRVVPIKQPKKKSEMKNNKKGAK